MAKIIIHRSSEFINAMRGIVIVLDGKNVGSVGNGKRMELEVEPGIHTFYGKLDWGQSPAIEVDIQEGETHLYQLSSFKYSTWTFLYAGVALILHAALQFPWPFLITIAPSALVLAYYLTIGSGKYLQLKKKD